MNEDKTLIIKKNQEDPPKTEANNKTIVMKKPFSGNLDDLIDEEGEKTVILHHPENEEKKEIVEDEGTVYIGEKTAILGEDSSVLKVSSFLTEEEIDEDDASVYKNDDSNDLHDKSVDNDFEDYDKTSIISSFKPNNSPKNDKLNNEVTFRVTRPCVSSKVRNVQSKKLFSRQQLIDFVEKQGYYSRNLEPKTELPISKLERVVDIDEIKVGYIIDNKYQLIELITKKSGEAAIYKCQVKGLMGVYVAKVYYPDIQPKEDIMEKILQNLNSENVVKLNMIGYILTSSGRRLYEIMPFYAKGNLEMRMPLAEEEIIKKIIPSINEGLRAIHRINIIHRDLKPNNLFIEEFGSDSTIEMNCKLQNNERIVIGDFGISSQIKDGATHRITSASRTRGYGAPETIRENITTPKSDYFSFGITLFTLINGEYPYHDEIEMILKIKDNIWNFPPNTSQKMQRIIKGLMEYDRSARWGYDEVFDWINDKKIQVRQVADSGFAQTKASNPYDFKFKKYLDIVSLVEAMIQDWDFSIQHIQNRFVENAFKGSTKEFDAVIQDMDRLRHISAGNDKIFLMLIYTVLKPEGIVYHGLNFRNLADMSDYILLSTEVDEKIIDLIKSRNLNYIITLISKYSSIGEVVKIKRIVEKIENLIKDDRRLAYYLLGYVFNRDKKRIDLVKNGIFPSQYAEKITSIEDVYRAYKMSHNREDFANDIMTNSRFKAWLYYMGYSQDKSFLSEGGIDNGFQ